MNAPHLVALVRTGAKFEKGTLVERPDGDGSPDMAFRVDGKVDVFLNAL